MASVARLKAGKPRTGRVIGDKFVGRAIRIYLPLLALLVVTLFPFYWMAVTSFKSASELFDFSVSPLWVREPTLDWYRHLFTQTNFPHWAFNTAVVATISTLISLFCSILARYPHPGHGSDRDPSGAPWHPGRRPLRLHPFLERVPLCADLHERQPCQDHPGRRHPGAHPR